MMFADAAVLKCKEIINKTANACPIDATTSTTEESEATEDGSLLKTDYEDDNDKIPQHQKKDDPTLGAMDNDGKPTRRNNLPLLTGSVQVGLLYDAKSDRPLYGDYLWPPAKNPKIIDANVPHSSMDFIFDESILDRLSLIDVDAELKLSFMTGMIKVIIFLDSE